MPGDKSACSSIAPDYLARAIRLRRGCGDLHLGTEGIVLAFNDARGRKWRQIAAVIRKAKALAEAEVQPREHMAVPADRHFANPLRTGRNLRDAAADHPMSAVHSAIIPAGKARPIGNGSLSTTPASARFTSIRHRR